MSIFFTPRAPSSQELLAEALGEGVGGGLQAGAKAAHDAVQDKKQSGAFEKALGLPEGSLLGLSRDELVPAAKMLSELRSSNERREQKEIDRAFRETKDFRQEVEKKGRTADRQLRTLELMEGLINSKKLATPVIAREADKSGSVGLLSPESQLFQKSLGDFLPKISDVYGARFTNQHEKTFLSTLPSLNQTDEGKRKVIRMLRTELEGERIGKGCLL